MSKKRKEKQITIDEKTLNIYKENVNEWFCSTCASGSGQPAKVAQNLRGLGYAFKETSPGRYAKSCFCEKCGEKRTHYMLLSTEPIYDEKPRCVITQEQRKRVKSLLGERDAFSGAKITTKAEIDHKTPFARLDQDINISLLSDEEIKEHFQYLTRDHNLLKDRKCQQCIKSCKRPPFFGQNFWYKGNENYQGTCEGCGWYDGEKWREEYNNYTEHQKAVDNAKSNLINYLYQSLNNDNVFL